MRRDEMRVEQELPVKYAKRESAREIRERTRKRKPVPAKYAKDAKKAKTDFLPAKYAKGREKKGRQIFCPLLRE